MRSISIIICTYNPEQEVFSRCLTAVSKLIHPPGIEVSCVVVDNNSNRIVADLPYVQDIAGAASWVHFVRESTPGLSYARARGINESNGDWLIFFDDDNEPEENYLIGIVDAVAAHPEVGIWGPGHINVVYLAPVDEWFETNKGVFQERHFDTVLIGNDHAFLYFYPPGTGMIFHKNVAEKWLTNFEKGIYTNVDRRAGSMESSGDTQIVHTAINSGFSIGSWPSISINHLTSAGKSNFAYMRRLIFGISVGMPKTDLEILKQRGETVPEVQTPPATKLFLKMIKFRMHYFLSSHKRKPYLMHLNIYYFGAVIGKYRLINKTLPGFLTDFIKDYRLEKN